MEISHLGVKGKLHFSTLVSSDILKLTKFCRAYCEQDIVYGICFMINKRMSKVKYQ